LLDDCGVVADAGVEAEVTTVRLAEAHALDLVALDGPIKLGEGDHRVVGYAERAHEDVGRPAREHGECGVAPRETGGHLVQGAVAAEGDHGIEPAGSRVLGETGGVTPLVGLDHLHVVVACQVLVDQDGVLGGHRGGERIDDEKNSQGAQVYKRTSPIFRVSGWALRTVRGNNGGMNIVVCVKQIPDPATPGALDGATNALKRDGKLILDESDGYGVEMALQLVAAAGSGEVNVVSMAPNGEVSGMRTALAMGAAKGVLVSDPSLGGSDALSTAKVLAAAIQKMGGADLVIAATESSDGYTGTVPEQMAEVLGLPSVTFAKKVEITGSTLKADRQTESGYDEVECPLPAVISVTAGVVEPRYPSFKGIMAAKSKPIDTYTAGDLGVTAAGWAGAGQKVVTVAQAEARKAGEIIEDDGNAFNKIVSYLENLKVI
jgi:electron transfer flavoprotein beta subunit